MVLGFNDLFILKVWAGLKRHSMRVYGRQWKAGDRADCFARTRQAGLMTLLLRAPVSKVQHVELLPPPADLECPKCGSGELHSHAEFSRVILDGEELDAAAKADLASADGFSSAERGSFYAMMSFFETPFRGQLVHWDFDRRSDHAPPEALLTLAMRLYVKPTGAEYKKLLYKAIPAALSEAEMEALRVCGLESLLDLARAPELTGGRIVS